MSSRSRERQQFKHWLEPKFVTYDDATEYMWYGRNGMKYFWYNEFNGIRP